MKETREETYKKIFIKSPDDLPKENGRYTVCKTSGKCWNNFLFVKDSDYQELWLNTIDWYLQPQEQECKHADSTVRYGIKQCADCGKPVTDKEATGEQEKRPEIVCICGSGRFLMQMHEVEERLTLEGKIVLMIGVNTKDVARTENLEHYKPMLDELHLRKIDISDKVFVVNVGGYIGESTRKEIVYSESHKKSIEYLERETQGKVPHFDIEGGGGVTINEIENPPKESLYDKALSFLKEYHWDDESLRKTDKIIPLVATMLEVFAKKFANQKHIPTDEEILIYFSNHSIITSTRNLSNIPVMTRSAFIEFAKWLKEQIK